MFNTLQYNAHQYNQGPDPTIKEYAILEYNGYEFNTDDVRIRSMPDIESMPEAQFETYNIAKDHGSGVNGRELRRKPLTISVTISGKSTTELEGTLTTLKSKVIESEKDLIYKRQDGKVLTTKATCTTFNVNREHYHITFIPDITIGWTITDPFFYSITNTQYAFEGQTSNVSSGIVYTEGSTRAEPQILVNFLSGISGVTEITATIGERSITVPVAASDGDSIEINSRDQEVKLNGSTGQDYSGQFPRIPIGSSSFSVDIDGTWEADIYVIWAGTYV